MLPPEHWKGKFKIFKILLKKNNIMKLTINQFQELKAVEVEFPSVIRGRNGAGKSTIKQQHNNGRI